MWTYVNTNELCHHGIKGMKWGIRRFQRKDGSLTPAGKKRYSDDDSKTRVPSEDHKQAQALKGKKLYEMSNKELEALTRRMQLEKQYKDLNRQSVSKGRQIVTSVLTEIGKETFKSFAKDMINNKAPALIKTAAENQKKSWV